MKPESFFKVKVQSLAFISFSVFAGLVLTSCNSNKSTSATTMSDSTTVAVAPPNRKLIGKNLKLMPTKN